MTYLLVRCLVLCLILCAKAALAQDIYVFQREAKDANDFAMHVLHEALERTNQSYGPYSLQFASQISLRPRHLALANGEDGVNINIFPEAGPVGDRVVPIPIPIDRGLLGNRVLLIHAEDQARFDAVRSLDDLKAFKFGTLGAWIDADIMREAGLLVETGNSYEGLFKMLVSKRFDALNRSVTEIWSEYERMKDGLPGIAIERGLLLQYPMASYFWVRNDDQGRRLGRRVYAGLNSMVRDGTLDSMFNAEFGPALAKLNLPGRRVLHIENSYLRLNNPQEDHRLSLDPITVK
jgi:hypothetical protein